MSTPKFLTDHLKLWEDLGIPAPVNELQSIYTWLGHLSQHGAEKTMETMRTRMLLLMRAANDLHDEGPAAEKAAGIYDNRPDMDQSRLDYVDPECTSDQDKLITPVSGFVAAKAYNQVCELIGGNNPDLEMQTRAPIVHTFFMKLFGAFK